MTKKEILLETAEFYKNNPRSLDGYACKYLDDRGNKCAFSRCCTEEGVKILQGFEGTGVGSIENVNGIIINDVLQERYKGHDYAFWVDVQRFHDNSLNWEENTLTKEGEDHLARLIEKYDTDNT